MTEITGGKDLKDLKPLAFDNSNRIERHNQKSNGCMGRGLYVIRDLWMRHHKLLIKNTKEDLV